MIRFKITSLLFIIFINLEAKGFYSDKLPKKVSFYLANKILLSIDSAILNIKKKQKMTFQANLGKMIKKYWQIASRLFGPRVYRFGKCIPG